MKTKIKDLELEVIKYKRIIKELEGIIITIPMQGKLYEMVHNELALKKMKMNLDPKTEIIKQI
tara:strand:- start:1185 stop:1373 length:189 start_codon:yes stop_codon:yes gene_type:complete